MIPPQDVLGFVAVKLTPFLACPPTFTLTTTFPLIVPHGTKTVMLVALQVVGIAVIPLKVTVLDPCVKPKFDPAIVTEEFTVPEVGFRLVMLGAPLTGWKAMMPVV